MSPRPVPAALLPWALSALGAADAPLPALASVAGDASARRYFRFPYGDSSYILAEAPPASEKNVEFMAVSELLRGAGIVAPRVFAADLEQGFLLLEDLGDALLLPALTEQGVDAWYSEAFDVLLGMARIGLADPQAVPGCYDEDLLAEELGRFPHWFVIQLLGCELSADDEAVIGSLSQRLIQSALEQPRVLVHRDFHSRNLMLTDGGLGVIDFQDAVMGPVTYDLVSLLRDCYLRWPEDRVQRWAMDYRTRAVDAGLLDDAVSEEMFLRWFDWMGLQRHIKVLGTFARLHLRDGKAAYLDDLPLVIHYVLEILERYRHGEPEFDRFYRWFTERLSPCIAARGWSYTL